MENIILIVSVITLLLSFSEEIKKFKRNIEIKEIMNKLLYDKTRNPEKLKEYLKNSSFKKYAELLKIGAKIKTNDEKMNILLNYYKTGNEETLIEKIKVLKEKEKLKQEINKIKIEIYINVLISTFIFGILINLIKNIKNFPIIYVISVLLALSMLITNNFEDFPKKFSLIYVIFSIGKFFGKLI